MKSITQNTDGTYQVRLKNNGGKVIRIVNDIPSFIEAVSLLENSMYTEADGGSAECSYAQGNL